MNSFERYVFWLISPKKKKNGKPFFLRGHPSLNNILSGQLFIILLFIWMCFRKHHDIPFWVLIVITIVFSELFYLWFDYLIDKRKQPFKDYLNESIIISEKRDRMCFILFIISIITTFILIILMDFI